MCSTKIALIGSHQCGKSSLLRSLKGELLNSTLTDPYNVSYYQYIVSEKILELWSLSFEATLLQWPFVALNIDTLFLCHNVTQPQSLNEVTEWYKKLQCKPKKCTLISLQCGEAGFKHRSSTQLNKAQNWSIKNNLDHFALNSLQNKFYKLKNVQGQLKLKLKQKNNTLQNFILQLTLAP
jgi:hypothetical protein